MIFAAFRYTASLAADGVEALLFGFNHLSDQAADRVWRDAGRPRSGAERLAEAEAKEECSEPSGPQIVEDENIPRGIVGYGYDPSRSPFGPNAAPGPDGVVCAYGCDAWSFSSECQQHGGPDERREYLGPYNDGGERYVEREAQAKESVFRPADIKFVFKSWRLDIYGRDRISLTVMADDGTSLQINDAKTADLLERACGQYLQEHIQQLAADEDNAHDLNNWLTPTIPDSSAAPSPYPPGPVRAEGLRVAPLPSSPTERDTEPLNDPKWEH